MKTMKAIKMMLIAVMMTIVTSASAITYSQAKDQALFLADKMAYELNLTDDQYEAAYEINLDYLMAVNDYNDLYGYYWTLRNQELQSILSSWQYNAYVAANYFYRPVYWSNNRWVWRIYARYTPTKFYKSRPRVYVTYRGGNSKSYYTARTWNRQPRPTMTAKRVSANSNRTVNIQNNRTINIQSNRQVKQTRSSVANNRTFGSLQAVNNAKTITNNGNTNSTFGSR